MTRTTVAIMHALNRTKCLGLKAPACSYFRQKVEDLDPKFFASLSQNDILFIDSSHVLRPQGDVLFEFLQFLPTLQAGVIVHIHDIFLPSLTTFSHGLLTT